MLVLYGLNYIKIFNILNISCESNRNVTFDRQTSEYCKVIKHPYVVKFIS